MTVDLTTRYLGLELVNPLVASASPLTGTLDSLRRLEDSGAAAVVLRSLFEEQLEHEEMEIARLLDFQSDSFAESLSYFPELENYNTGPNEYLELIAQAKSSLSIPVIASLNGSSLGGWVHYAKEIESAGASGLELNVYVVPTDPTRDAADIENGYYELVSAVRAEVNIPLAVKIGPYFSSLPHMAARLIQSGADGLVFFNRYLEPDIDLDSLTFKPNIILSQPQELRLSLRWIAILRDQLSASLAATSGIHSVEDVVKALLAGADVAMCATVLLKNGTSHLATLRNGLSEWMTQREYASVEQLKGSMSKQHSPNPEGLERANYMQALTSYTDASLGT